MMPLARIVPSKQFRPAGPFSEAIVTFLFTRLTAMVLPMEAGVLLIQ